MSTTEIIDQAAVPVVAVPPSDGLCVDVCTRESETSRPSRRRGQSPLPPKPPSALYESLDMWRGIACLMLVFYHAAFFVEDSMQVFDSASWSIAGAFLYAVKKTWCGVPIFFVISGYCIAASLDSLRRRPHSLSNYFYRRMRRIYPPLWFATILAIAWLLFAQSQWNLEGAREHLPFLSDLTAIQWFGNFTATERWLYHVAGGETRYLMANTWTLCYEEQFYAVAGLMLLIAPRRPLVVAFAVSMLTLVGRHVFRACGWDIEGFFWDGHWLLFAAGLIVYQTVNYFTRPQAIAACLVLAAGVVYGWWERRTGPTWFEQHLGEYFLVASSFALFLVAAKRFDRTIARSLLARPLVWCGKRSYSIYLAHFPLVVPLAYGLYCCGLQDAWSTVFITVPCCLAVSILAGWGFYNLVECHFQNAVKNPAAGAEAA